MQNFSYENEFDLHENEAVGETDFHMNGFALRLVLTQRQTRTRKWAILSFHCHRHHHCRRQRRLHHHHRYHSTALTVVIGNKDQTDDGANYRIL